MMTVGVLALQGDAREHLIALAHLGVAALPVRSAKDLAVVQALIIPGGESTVIGNLLKEHALDQDIIHRVRSGMPVWGTCAGAILLATAIEGSDQPRLGLWNMRIARNAYGRQAASFETTVEVQGIGNLPAVFIRAPVIASCEGKILARHNGQIIMARHGNMLATTFHPELTDDARVHSYFLHMIE